MNDAKNGIPLLEVQLPVSGYTVVIYQYLTTGESRELQKIMLEGGTFNPEAGKIENMPVDTFLKMQDKAAEFLIKEIKNKDGASQPFSFEWLYNLPVTDGNLVYDKINEITGASTLTPEGKKQ